MPCVIESGEELPVAANEAYREISREILDKGWWEVALPAVFAGWGRIAAGYIVPPPLGNVLGGSALFAVISHGQVKREH